MRKKRQFIKLLSITLFNSITVFMPYTFVYADAPITTQAQVDALDLLNGNVMHQSTGTNLYNVKADEALNFVGNGTNTIAFTAGTVDNKINHTYTTVVSSSQAIDFNDFEAMDIQAHVIKGALDESCGGLSAEYGGAINVNASVKKLIIDLTDTNIGTLVEARTGSKNAVSTIKLDSSQIQLSNGTDTNNAVIVSNGYEADKVASYINIGSDNQYVNSLTIDGGKNSNGQVKGAGIGVMGKYYGQVNIYGNNIDITAGTPLSAYGSGMITVYAGSGTEQGLVIKPDINTGWGIGIWSQYNNSLVQVLSGNVTIDGGTWGTYAGNGRYGAGDIKLGTTNQKLDKVSIRTSDYGMESYGGNNLIYANQIDIQAPYAVLTIAQTTDYTGLSNNVEIHGDSKTTIIGDIYNQSGVVNVNNLPNDGSMEMTGNIYTGVSSGAYATNKCITEIGVQGKNSYVTGIVQDKSENAATTLYLNNGGVWNVTGNSNLDTLKLDTGGVVNLTQNTEYQHVTAKNMTG
ncbi:MAG: hypothetical protein LKF40_07280, partial [Megasphaera sp.]|nr:hypothetical protein [Megasphaera sp.]